MRRDMSLDSIHSTSMPDFFPPQSIPDSRFQRDSGFGRTPDAKSRIQISQTNSLRYAINSEAKIDDVAAGTTWGGENGSSMVCSSS